MQSLASIFTDNIFEKASIYTEPVRHIVVDNFLPADVVNNLYIEQQSIPVQYWSTFTRRDSKMHECKNLSIAPAAFNLVSYLHSASFLTQLSAITGVERLIPDPHLVGAGYSSIGQGYTLKKHVDFNWVEELHLHRAVSLIIYLTPGWLPEWGGELNFYDSIGENVVSSVSSLHNRCLIWNYDEHGWHGCETPMRCPEDVQRTAFRLFYYISNAEYKADNLPHRSLYWRDANNKPMDMK